MRRLWISLGLLAAVFCATLVNTHSMHRFTDGLIQLLTEAEACAVEGDWETAALKTDAALERWQEREGYLHIVLHHSDADDILLEFQAVRQFIEHHEDGGEYSAANARLVTRIGLLYEMEQLNLKNLL